MATAAEIFATTDDHWVSPMSYDTIHVGRPLLHWMKMSCGYDLKGGSEIVADVTWRGNDQLSDAYVPGTTDFSTRPQSTQQKIKDEFRYVAAPVYYDKVEVDKNSDPHQMVDLIGARTESTEQDVAQKYEERLLSLNATNKINGIRTLVGKQGTRTANSEVTIHGIDVGNGTGTDLASNVAIPGDWFNPQVVTDATATKLDKEDVSKLLRMISKGGARHTNLLLTRDKLYGQLQKIADGIARNTTDVGKYGYATFTIDSTPVMYPDESIATTASLEEKRVYALSSSGLKLMTDPRYATGGTNSSLESVTDPGGLQPSQMPFFNKTPWTMQITKEQWVCIVSARGQLITTDRSRNGYLEYTSNSFA